MATEILCATYGLQTPEGADRCAKALDNLAKLTAHVANLAEQFIKDYDTELAELDEDAQDQLVELDDAMKARCTAQDELLRAVAGREAVTDANAL